MKIRSGARIQVIDVQHMALTLGKDVCLGLLGLHSFTGCDSVSAFAGKGKLAALKLLKTDKEVQQTFADLGKQWDLSDDLFEKLEVFTCKLYAPKQEVKKINDLRYLLLCSRNGDIESHQLPPCQDALKQHARRANYQAAIWKRSISGDYHVPSPVQHGWEIRKEGGLDILDVNWMTIPPAPDAILELLACKCPKECKLLDCICMQNRLKCTDMCKAKACCNQPQDDDDEELRHYTDDEGDDD